MSWVFQVLFFFYSIYALSCDLLYNVYNDSDYILSCDLLYNDSEHVGNDERCKS